MVYGTDLYILHINPVYCVTFARSNVGGSLIDRLVIKMKTNMWSPIEDGYGREIQALTKSFIPTGLSPINVSVICQNDASCFTE